MNIFALLENKGLNTADVKGLLEEENYEALYDQCADVIKELLFLTDKEEFQDFLEEEGALEPEPFWFAYASHRKVCCSIGMYEENAADILAEYTKLKADVKLCKNYENAEDLVADIEKINTTVSDTGKLYIAFMDDTYCEGCYYIFAVDAEMVNERWDGECVERIC